MARSDHVASGSEADAALMTNQEFDLLILDLGLPKMHGSEVLGACARGSTLPVLIRPRPTASRTGSRGSTTVPTTTWPSPSALQELEARVRALTRRGMGGATSQIKHGPLVYDQAGRVATIDGKMIELSARELGLLEVLLQRAGPPGQQGPAGRAPVRMGRGGQQQRHRGLHPPPAQEDREGPIRIATVRGLGYRPEKIPG